MSHNSKFDVAMSRVLSVVALCLAVTVMLSSCDSGGSDGDDNNKNNSPGSFSATITGHVSASLAGVAVSTGSAGTGGWGIVFGPGKLETMTLVAAAEDRPSSGTHPIVAFNETSSTTPEIEFFGSVVLENGTASYSTKSGTLTITSSSSTRVEGSFNFTAERFVGQEITVTGTFSATNTGG
jgi:hypothetical protein